MSIQSAVSGRSGHGARSFGLAMARNAGVHLAFSAAGLK
jgi:hypothetical protein